MSRTAKVVYCMIRPLSMVSKRMKRWRGLDVVEVVPPLLHLTELRTLVVVFVESVSSDRESVTHNIRGNVLREPVRDSAASHHGG